MNKHRRMIFLALVAGVLVVMASSFIWFFWPAKPYRLKLVRQGIEQGKPVAYFRIQGGDRRKIAIAAGELIGEKDDYANLFWGPPLFDQSPPCDPKKGRRVFGVVVPATASVWHLRVVFFKDAAFKQRFIFMARDCRELREGGVPFLKAALRAFESFHGVANETVESDPITNSVPHT